MLAAFRQALIEHARIVPFADVISAEGHPPLLELYIERTLLLRVEDPSTLSTHSPSEKRSLSDLIREPSARVLLIGEPGAGKTTCLYHLALDYANSETALEQIAALPEPRPLPLLFQPRSRSSTPESKESVFVAGHPDLPFTLPLPSEDQLRIGLSDTLLALKHQLQSG